MEINKPIPIYQSVDGWKEIPIIENNEKLIELSNFSPEKILVQPKYYIQKIPCSIKEQYVRETVAFRLLEAANLLPYGYKFLIWDAWRPVAVQQALFNKFKTIQQNENPTLNESEIIINTQKYVSIPSVEINKPSPHLTGGSIDLTIVNSDGIGVDMGTEFDFFGKEAQTDFYERFICNETLLIQNNRRLLYNILIEVGFTNYSEEWWHFDFGNQFWAIQKGQTAVYSITQN